MRTRLVVETDVFGDETTQVLFAKDEDVIEQLSTERADEPLGEGVHIGRARRRPHDVDADAFEGGRERATELSVTVAYEDLWALIHGRIAGLLRGPRIGRGIGHRGMNDLAPTHGVLGDELQVRSENVCREVASEPEEVEHGPARTPIRSRWHL